MRVWVTTVFVAIALSLSCTAQAYTPPAGSPLAKREHPRLWLTQANLTELRAKLAGDFRAEYQNFVRDLDGRMTAPKSWRPASWGTDVMNYAFVYRLGAVSGISYGNPLSAYGERAKMMLLQEAADRPTDPFDNLLGNAPLAYDWVFDLLSPAERSSVVAYLKTYIDGTSGSGGNPFNQYDISYRTQYLLAGLAFWGDAIDDAAADTMVGKYNTLIEGPTGILGAGSFYSGTDGGFSMGFSYSWGSGTGLNVPRLLEGWRTANGLSRSIFTGASSNDVRYYSNWVAYHVLPPTSSCSGCPGGYAFPMYKTHYMDAGLKASSISSDFKAILAAHRLYKSIDPNVAGLVQWLIDNRVGGLGSTGYDGQIHAVFSHFIAGEKGIVPKSPTDLGLPLTKRFTNSGWVVMRTGWGDPSDSMVTFTASPFSRAAGTYTNYNQGAFTIDHRGPLAINSGSAIHQDYANRTWAYNTMIFPDPAETSRNYWDMGGQRYLYFPQLLSTNQLTAGAAHDIGGIKRFVAGGPYDYVKADVTRAYNGPLNADSTNTQKVSLFTRQLVYLHPDTPGGSDRVIVFDRTQTTDPKFEKRWLLHPSASSGISISGSLVTATNTAPGSAGTLYSKTLLPVDAKIKLVGGSGSEYTDPYGNNDAREAVTADPQYRGTYRVEVTPAVKNMYDTFLHVLEATDAGGAQTPTGLLTGSGMVAARVGQDIAAFSQTEGDITSAYLTMDVAGTFNMLICDLTPGATYMVSGNVLTASSAGTIAVDISSTGSGSRISVTRGTTVGVPAPAPATAVQVLRAIP